MTEETKYNPLITSSSPKALKLVVDKEAIGTGQTNEPEPNAKYPFSALKIGSSFIIPFDKTEPTTLNSLRVLAIKYSNNLKRKFKVLVQTEYKCIEVARIG